MSSLTTTETIRTKQLDRKRFNDDWLYFHLYEIGAFELPDHDVPVSLQNLPYEMDLYKVAWPLARLFSTCHLLLESSKNPEHQKLHNYLELVFGIMMDCFNGHSIETKELDHLCELGTKSARQAQEKGENIEAIPCVYYSVASNLCQKLKALNAPHLLNPSLLTEFTPFVEEDPTARRDKVIVLSPTSRSGPSPI